MRATRRPVSIAAILAMAVVTAACGDHADAALDEGPAGDGLEAAVHTAAGTSGSQADPDGFAPRAVVPPSAQPGLAAQVAAIVIPSRDEVGVPAPPGARIYGRVGVGGSASSRETRLYLISDDEPARVVDYYRQQLTGWSHGRDHGLGMDYFWESGPEFHPLGSAGDPARAVIVSAPLGSRTVAPDARSEIEVRY